MAFRILTNAGVTLMLKDICSVEKKTMESVVIKMMGKMKNRKKSID